MKRTVLQYLSENLFNIRIIKFSVVGAGGLVINMGFLYIFTQYLSVEYKLSSIIAIELSIISNFLFNNYWTWSEYRKETFFKRALKYHISVLISAVGINWLILVFLTEYYHVYYLLSNLIGIIIGTLFNFIMNDVWTFQKS
jgi:dolichol-phosphate mannosyltransferase